MIALFGDFTLKQRFLLISIIVLALLLTACGTTVASSVETIRGSGNVVTTERNVTGFSRIQINLGADLALTQGNSESLTIEADDNLMQYIETKIDNGRLIISTPNNVSVTPSRFIKLNVDFSTLREIEILGSSNITANALDLDTLTIRFSGSGSTGLTGSVNEQIIVISGQATMHNFGLISNRVTVDISGNGTIEVNAEDTLNLTVAGMGIIRYTGDPTISQQVNGSANISHR
jgi:hypothetical protein